MTEKTQPPQLSTAGIPHHAIRAWRALGAALQANPEVPCRTVLTPNHWGSEFSDERRAAAAACAGCPALLECQTYAFTAPEKSGVWGGLTPEDRQRPPRRTGTAPNGRGPTRGTSRRPRGA